MKNFSSQFDGKIAVITGGTQGLGLATAQLLAVRGAAGLIICGRNADKGEEAAAALAGDHCPTSFVKADLAEVADCQNVVPVPRPGFAGATVLVKLPGET